MIKKQFKENINIQIRPNLTHEVLKSIVQNKNQDIKVDTHGIRSLRDSHEINSGLLKPSVKTQKLGDNNKANGKQPTLKRKNQLSRINQQAKKHKKFPTKIKQNVAKMPHTKKEEYLQKIQEDKQQPIFQEIIQKNIEIIRTDQIQCQLISSFKVIQKPQKLQFNKKIQPKHQISHNLQNKKMNQKEIKDKPTQLLHNIKDTKPAKKPQHPKITSKKQMPDKTQNEDKKRLQKAHQKHPFKKNKDVKIPKQIIDSPCQKILEDIFEKVFQNIGELNKQSDKLFSKIQNTQPEQVYNEKIEGLGQNLIKQQNYTTNSMTYIDKKQERFDKIETNMNQNQLNTEKKTHLLKPNRTNHEQNRKKGVGNEELKKKLLSNNVLQQSTNKKRKRDDQNIKYTNEKVNNFLQNPQNKIKKPQMKNQIIHKNHRQKAELIYEQRLKKN